MTGRTRSGSVGRFAQIQRVFEPFGLIVSPILGKKRTCTFAAHRRAAPAHGRVASSHARAFAAHARAFTAHARALETHARSVAMHARADDWHARTTRALVRGTVFHKTGKASTKNTKDTRRARRSLWRLRRDTGAFIVWRSASSIKSSSVAQAQRPDACRSPSGRRPDGSGSPARRDTAGSSPSRCGNRTPAHR